MSDTMNTSGSGVAKVAGLLGWLAVAGGVVLAAYGAYLMFATDADRASAITSLVGGALTAGFGLLAILNSIMAGAMIDTANATARLLAAGGTVAAPTTAAAASADAGDGLPDFSAKRDDDFGSSNLDTDPLDDDDLDDVPDLPPFDTAPAAPMPSAAPIVPDTSDPRLWPLAIDEFDLDGHLAMTLEDGSVAVETSEGWRRLASVEEARAWLSQGV